MRIVIFLVLAVLALAGPSAAQVPGLPSLSGSAPSEAAESGRADAASLDQLIGILENEEARNTLLQSLKAAAYRPPRETGTQAQAQADESAGAELSVPGQIARWSQAVIGSAFGLWGRVEDSAEDAESLLSGAGALDLPRLADAILPVVLVAFVVFCVFFASRYAKTPVYRRLVKAAERAGPLQKMLLLALSGLAGLVSILVSLASGYVAAMLFYGGPPNINQALFLNAFLFIELVKVVFAMFVSPLYPTLRLTPFGDNQARYWYFWISRLIAFLGYAFLFVAPVVEASSSLAAANAMRFVAAFVSLLTIIFLILQNRTLVRDRLRRGRINGDQSFGARFYAMIGHVWWIAAIVFVLSLFSVWLSSPQEGLRFMTVATLKSIGAMAVGGFLVTILSKVILSGIRLPDRIKDRLPLLERRVNSFIPNALTVLRVVVILVVVGFILEAWSLFDLDGWAQTELGQRFVGGAIGAGVVILLGFLVFLGVSSWVEYRLNPNYGTIPTARERTLLALFRNAFTITLFVITAMLILSQIGINIGPLLAGAGVVGLAVGFGAQKLVQDIITGAFIQFENAMNEGDIVLVAGATGTVERLTIRSVGLRSLDGTYHLIPFSSVDQVANMTKDFSQFVADVGIAYREDTAEVKALMREAFDELKAGEQGVNLIADFEMFGVNELGASAVVVRGRIKTLPGKQWAVGRAYNEIVKRLCDAAKVELAYPQMTVWFGEDKRGNAPPVHLTAPPAQTVAIQSSLGEQGHSPAGADAPSPRHDGDGTSDGRSG